MIRQKQRHGVLTALIILFLLLTAQRDAVARQQYLVVNIIPGERYEEVFQQVRKLQSPKSSAHVRVGIGAIFSYLNESRDRCKSRVTEFLSLAKQYDIPVVVQLDGEQWWEARPDLWNWWDPGRAGYNPRNRWNVE
jgi:predicted metal-dependent TIM-barrel fold hydrolase